MYFSMDIKRNWETFVFMYFLMVLIPCQGSKSEIFEVNTDFDDFRLNGETLDTLISSGESECVLRCSVRDECLSVQYNSLTGECRLLHDVYVARSYGVEDKKWRYYQKTGGVCPSQFTLYAEDHTCFHYAGLLNIPMGTDYCKNLNASLIAIQSERMQAFLASIVEKIDSDVKSAYIQGTFNTTHWVLDNQQLLPFTHWGLGEPRMQNPGFVNIKVKQASGNYFWQTARGLKSLRHVFCGIIV